LYLPSQDKIISGLSANQSQTNILKGANQQFDMTHPLDKNTNSNPDLANSQLYPKSVNEDGEEVDQ